MRNKFLGTGEPGYAACKQAGSSLSAGNIPEITAGNYICVRTNKNRYSQVRIDEVESIAAGTGSIRLSFITWEEQ